MKENKLIVFSAIVGLTFLALFISYTIQANYIPKIETELSSYLVKSYLLNFSLFFGGGLLFFFLEKKFKDHLGFLFLFWIFIKYAICLKVFYSEFKSDGVTTKTELLIVTIPYLIGLISITILVSRFLNKSK